VRAIDKAGNISDTAKYTINSEYTDPTVTVVGPKPQFGDKVTVKFTPRAGVVGTKSYDYALNGAEPKVVNAAADGSATVTFVADRPNGPEIDVRSHSVNGFVSTRAHWSYSFEPWPDVTSAVYPQNGGPSGGVGVSGAFTFSRPAGVEWLKIHGYQYSFNGSAPAFVVAGADGRATIEWTPTVSGDVELEVYPVRADGSLGTYSNIYYFTVA
jgi:hypothetical protein